MRLARACSFAIACWIAALPAFACDAIAPLATATRAIALPGSRPAEVTLPDKLDADLRRQGPRIRYTLDVSRCRGAAGSAIWLFRVGAPYRIEDDAGRPLTLLSARPMFRPEMFTSRGVPAQEGVYNGRIPAVFALPAGANHVQVELLTLAYIPAGIVRASTGPAHALLPVQSQAIEDVVAHADAASGVVLVLGMLAALLWFRRRADRGLLWLAIACGLWGLRGLLYFGHEVYWPPLVFEQFNSLNVLLTAGALCASVLWLLGRPTRTQLRTAAAATALGTAGLLLSFALPASAAPARAVSLAIGFLLTLATLAQVVRRRAELAPGHAVLLAFGLGGLLMCAVHDMLVVAGTLGPDSPSWVFWGFIALLVGFAVMSGQYVVSTLNRAERSNAELARHLAERERLLRDMHDGLGAQLMTTLRAVERGALQAPQLTQSLQDSLEELRLLMDSTDMGEYLPGALASWRNRWDARLEAAGVSLEWRIDDALDQVQLSGDTAMQVMRILQEGAANIVKHAKARNMAFSAQVRDAGERGTLCIEIADDGIGLPAEPSRPGGRGLKNMRLRAQQIGARLHVEPGQGGGTLVRLEVPL